MKRLNDNDKVSIIDLDQSTGDWLQWRNAGIGSSDVALLMSPDPVFDRTVGTLWKQRCGYERAVELDNEHIQRGKDLEPKIRDKVNEILGTNFEPVCVMRNDAPYLRASLDGIDYDHDALLEIKAPSDKVFEKYFKTWQIPDNYYLQMQYQMLCSDVDHGYFAFAREEAVQPPFELDKGVEPPKELEVYIIPVKNNHQLQLDIERRCSLFMRGVQDRIPVGWIDGELSLYDTNPTMFVVLGESEQMKQLYAIKNFPVPIVETFYGHQFSNENYKLSFIVGIGDPRIIPMLKREHPHHHVKIINLVESPFSNSVDEVELTKAGLLKHIRGLV